MGPTAVSETFSVNSLRTERSKPKAKEQPLEALLVIKELAECCLRIFTSKFSPSFCAFW
jgi:hypothetical protein